MIILNFDETFEVVAIESNLSQMVFNSPQADGTNQQIIVKIDPHNDPNLQNVHNLGFGPPNGKGRFKDDVRLKHADINKTFSTVLLFGLAFLLENPDQILGIDGSDDSRAALYHMMFKTNREYLNDFFVSIGVDWYVRVYRNGDYETNDHNEILAKPKPEPFNFERDRHDIYRYYMFHLK